MVERPLLAAARTAGADVVLDGQGGDELFGVAGFLLGDRLRAGRLISAWSLARNYPEFGDDPPRRQVARLLNLQGVPAALPRALQEQLLARRPSPTPAWLLPATAALHRETYHPWDWKRRSGPLWWRSLADVLTTGREVADIADYVRRRATMAGLEGRSPWLSAPLVKLVLQLPPELNFDPRWTRALVREAARGLLPEEVRCRILKTNFAELNFRAVSDPGSLAMQRRLFDGRPEIAAYVDVAALRRRVVDDVPEAGQPGWRQWLTEAWNVTTAEMWLRQQAGLPLRPD
jgi:asparagine synthase (glutamine-hydrolysing)